MTVYTKEQQAEHRQQWTAALRSGDYPQGKFALKTAEGNFCCLGVACELAVAAGVTKRIDRKCNCSTADCTSGSGYENYDGNPVNSTLPDSVREWLGLEAAGGSLKETVYFGDREDENYATSLAGLNDDGGWTFAQIADLVDADGVVLQQDGGAR